MMRGSLGPNNLIQTLGGHGWGQRSRLQTLARAAPSLHCCLKQDPTVPNSVDVESDNSGKVVAEGLIFPAL